MPSLSRKQLDLFLVTVANLAAMAVVIYEYRFGDLERIPGLISCVVAICGVNALMLVSIRLRNKRIGQLTSRNLIALAAVFAVISVAVSMLVILMSPSGGDVVKLAYSKVPLIVIHPEPKRLMVELLRRRETNSRIYGQVAASAKPLARRCIRRNPSRMKTPAVKPPQGCNRSLIRTQHISPSRNRRPRSSTTN